ncbi:hypothetical protein [Bernardetia sp. MNP-M8]|uniref:hypothetical protein n=1 Tax=Bernardetia sp. MNP-M8 TaxID=3127470 RepID=UPI0030D1E3DF
MTNSITILSNSPILQESRQDPITGDLIKEGDKVVICASCKSAFLEGSWKYLGEKHCNQTETLSQIPAKQDFKFVKRLKKLEQVIFSAESYGGNTALIVAVPTGIISFIISISLVLSFIQMPLLWGVVGLLISIPFIFNAFQTKGIEVKETAIYIKKGFGRKKRIAISDIKQIEFIYHNGFEHTQMLKNGEYISSISTPPTIRLKGKNYSTSFTISEYDFNRNREKVVEFFSKIANIVSVHLNTNEKDFIEEFEAKVSNVNIKTGLEGIKDFYGIWHPYGQLH